MEFQVIGVEKRSFRPKDADRDIVGYNVYVAYEQNGVIGAASKSVYIKQRFIYSLKALTIWIKN